jgi:integrase
MQAAHKSRSPALLPLFVFSLDTGMRASEVRAMKLRDLRLVWVNGVIVEGDAIVPKSKTDAGTGRIIPLTQRACATLTMWLARFPEASPGNYLFPRHKVGFAGNSRIPVIWGIDLNRPIGEWKKAWSVACRQAGVQYRWHDLRHTFISRQPKIRTSARKH